MTPVPASTLMLKALRELMLALGVLALVFLSFGHQPLAAGPDSAAFRLVDGSIPVFCGSGGPHDQGHVPGPCHACRAQITDLPPPPCDAAPAFAGFTFIAHRPAPPVIPARAPHMLKAPRAPPFVV